MTNTPDPSLALPSLLAETAWVQRLALRLVKDEDDADDLVQDAWVSALRKPPRTGGSLRPWLGTVLRHTWSKRIRAATRRQAREQAALGVQETAPSPAQLLERVELQKLIVGAVTDLEEPFRQTILLRYFEGRSAAEIARLLAVPAGTVRWRLKTALDRLRAELDRRFGGDRNRWAALLAPFSGSTTLSAEVAGAGGAPTARRVLGLPPSAAIALVALVGGLAVAIGGGVSSRRWAGGDMATGTAPVAGASGEAVGRSAPAAPGGLSPGPVSYAATAGGFAACQADAKRLRGELAAAEIDVVKTVNPEIIFGRGQPNPKADAALGPIIARIMKGENGTAPSYTLSCRTWACRLEVVQTPDEQKRANEWTRPLQRDEEMVPRTTGVSFHGAGKARDPVSGTVLDKTTVTIRLADPSGKAVERGLAAAAAAPTFGALPTTLDACRAEVADLGRRLAVARAEINRDLPPQRRFDTLAPNPKLLAEVKGLVAAALGEEASSFTIDCRGQICRFTNPDMSKLRMLQGGPFGGGVFKGRTAGTGSGPAGHFVIFKTTDELSAEKWLNALLDEVAASPAIPTCTKKFPNATGNLGLSLALTAASAAVENSERLKLTASLDIGGTELAACIEGEAERIVASASPPPALPSATAHKRLAIPQPAAP